MGNRFIKIGLCYLKTNANALFLLQEETQHLQLEVHQIQQVPSYSDIVNDLVKRVHCSGARDLNFYYSYMIFIYIFIVALSKLQIT